MQASRERKIACQLWLTWDQATEPQTPQYKEFLNDLVRESESSEPNIKLKYGSAKEFAEHIKATVNEESIASTGVEQLAVVCSNLRSNVGTYKRFYDSVITAIDETDRLSILPTFDNATGHIRLEEIERDINRADTIVVICFDQAWGWARNIMGQIRQLIKADAAKRARLLIIGPPAREGFEVNASAFRFTTLNANAIDEQQLREFLKEALEGSGQRGKESPTQTVN